MSLPSPSTVRDVVQAYSDRCFFGRLHDVPVRWRRMYYCDAYVNEDGVCLSTYLARTWEWRAVLLHEMIHVWLYLGGDQDEWHLGTVAHHGPSFTAQCNRVGRLMGLPPVVEEDSWAWPWTAMGESPVTDVDE